MLVEEFTARARRSGMEVAVLPDLSAAHAEVRRRVGGGSALVDRTALLSGLDVPAPDDPWDADVGVSEAFSAAAESGTVALVQRAGSPRRTSLLPPEHVVLVPVDRIRATYQQLVDDLVALRPRPTGVQLVSGASRSGDIESAMIHGMHGPRQVTLLVVR